MELYYVMTVLERAKEKKVTEIYRKQGSSLILTVLGHGTATEALLDRHGLEMTEKAVVITIADAEKKKELFRQAKKELMVDIPGNGIMLAVPVKSVGGGDTLAFLTNGSPADKGVPDMAFQYELILVVANQGYTDLVMEAARSAGARGGTVIHAKGTGTEYARKFLDLHLAAEKEIILIASAMEDKAEIMKRIRAQAGPETPGGAISLSLPVSSIAGLRELEGE